MDLVFYASYCLLVYAIYLGWLSGELRDAPIIEDEDLPAGP